MKQDCVEATAQPGSHFYLTVDKSMMRQFWIVLWVSAVVTALSVIGLLFTRDELRTVKAKYEVLQYDQQALKAQLVAKGIYEGTEH